MLYCSCLLVKRNNSSVEGKAKLLVQQQTYTCSHGIFLNSKTYKSANDSTNYCPLLTDIKISKGSSIKIAYGEQGHQHLNHITALQQFNLDQFDLVSSLLKTKK